MLSALIAQPVLPVLAAAEPATVKAAFMTMPKLALCNPVTFVQTWDILTVLVREIGLDARSTHRLRNVSEANFHLRLNAAFTYA